MPDDKSKPYCYEYPRPALTADAIVFRKGEEGAELLLIQRKAPPFEGAWSFPGGFFDEKDNSIEEAAARELREETGLSVDLQLFAPFSEPGRDPRGRTVTVAYYGWAEDGAEPKAGDDAANLEWHSLDKLPALAFDHGMIIKKLRAHVGI